MSQLSFKAFCIEYYAKHIGQPSNEAYQLFQSSGLLALLDSDYEDLHGMDMENLMQFCDEYLKGQSSWWLIAEHLWQGDSMDHYTIRATILPDIIRMIAKQHDLSEDQALDAFYCSATGAAFADDDTGLYGQSPLYIFGLYEEELILNDESAALHR